MKYTIEDLRALDLCYDPGKYLPEDWTGTWQDIMAVKECPIEDRLSVIYRLDVLTSCVFDKIVERIIRFSKQFVESENKNVKFSAFNALWFSARFLKEPKNDTLVLSITSYHALRHFLGISIVDPHDYSLD